MLCSNCGRENRIEAAFCDSCGAPLSAPNVHADDLFVGRERELAMMRAALEQTVAGRGRVMMVCGDPGIGKTHTAQWFSHYAEQRKVQVLWGRSHEEPGAPPYRPWLQAIRGYLEAQDDASIQASLGNAASSIAEIVPEIAQRLPDLPSLPPTSDAAAARFRLFDAITGFWKRAAAEQPLALIFDDLHWADTPSLKLLEFLAAELRASRLFVLGTYRDVQLTRAHPLSNTLGELARHSGFQRLRLTGLSFNETRQLMSTAAGQSLPSDLITEIHTLTEGNPLFLAEMTRFLLHEGVLGASRDWRHPGRSRRRIPEGVREVIGARLNRLSLTCNRVLAAAAVIGRSFSIDVLNRMLDDVIENECLAALEEALTAGVIEELPESGVYQFHHALIRETLFDEMPVLKRTRLHQRIGAALEALYRDDLTPYLSSLAHHYGAALPGGDVAKAIDYARRAGERANALLAYEEAARAYRLALQSLELQAGVQAQRFKLQLALGDTLIKAGENFQALEVLRLAAAEAKARGSAEDLARAAVGFEDASWRPGLPGEAAVRLLEEALQALGAQDSIIEAQVLSSLTRALIFTGALDQAAKVKEQAVAMARRLGDPATLAAAHRASLAARWQPEQLSARLSAESEVISLTERAGDKEQLMDALGWRMFDLMETGDVAAARADLEAQNRLAEELRQPYFLYVNVLFRATLALFEGRLDECERLAGQGWSMGRRLPGQDVDGVYGLQMFSLRREQGRLHELAPLVSQFVQTTPQALTWRPGLALIYAELGFTEKARTEFANLAADDFSAIPRDGVWPACIVYLAEVCAFLEDTERAHTLYRFLLPYDSHNIVVGGSAACYGAAARFLGMLATTMKRWEDAERHFEAALEMNARQGARLWLAHTQYQYALMLIARRHPGDREQAESLWQEALATSREVGMRALEQRITVLQQQADYQSARQRYPAGLSRREVEVLRLVAAGKANRAIAKRLFVSENTVANHMRSILAKTHTANRTEAAAFATRHGLLGNSSEGA
ncbi:MAG TPA: BREX system ATP-binding domain-containing protein [Burkholderiales bacterium]|nr:BREX system ATP-binding domain-containing protein [Burkholderiales bacterium]